MLPGLLIIAALLILLFLLSRKEPGKTTSPPPKPPSARSLPSSTPVGVAGPAIIQPKTTPSIIQNKDDGKYRILRHKRILHRKTFISGTLVSKFFGELDYIKDQQKFVRERYFDFTLYEAEIKDTSFRKNNEGPFPEFNAEEVFPGRIAPYPLPCKISYKDIKGDFEIILYDTKLADIDFSKHRLLHQEEDDQVFGVVEARVTGYLLEQFIEEFDEKVEIGTLDEHIMEDRANARVSARPLITKTDDKTGRIKTEDDYTYEEYWYSDKTSTWWGNPQLVVRKQTGCLGDVGLLLLIIPGILFLIALGPRGILGLLVLTLMGLIIAYFVDFLKWIVILAGCCMLFFAIASIVSAAQEPRHFSTPTFVRDAPQEVNWVEKDNANSGDSLIVHHRIWKDYSGRVFEGDVWVKIADFKKSSYYKNTLTVRAGTTADYDRVLSDLMNQDASKLEGVYKLMDSIRISNHQGDIRFAETMVSFVQDIPYALVLDKDCNPNLYSDPFTKSYLQSGTGLCDGSQRFGINTPVEFIGTLKGDCDTRTLLLYTLLLHYGYDVALLSSEIYSHSLLAVNLPISGKVFSAYGKDYVVWETTVPGVPPGLLPRQVSDLSNWRVSLISKK